MNYTKKKFKSPLKLQGGKANLARPIVSLFPDNSLLSNGGRLRYTRFADPTCGTCVVPLNLDAGQVEKRIMGDIDPDLINFWKTFQKRSGEMAVILAEIPYGLESFNRWKAVLDSPITVPYENHKNRYMQDISRAVAYLVTFRMSQGARGNAYAKPGAGQARLRGGQPDNINAFETILKDFPRMARQVSSWGFHNLDAASFLDAHVDHETIAYIDPPYPASTRTARKVYRHEMTDADHVRVLEAARRASDRGAKVFVSGYEKTPNGERNELYEDLLDSHGWVVVYRKGMANHSASAKRKRRVVEAVWGSPDEPSIKTFSRPVVRSVGGVA